MPVRTTLLNSRYTLYHDRDFSALQRDLVKEGVVDDYNDGNDLLVSPQGGNMKLDIERGSCYVRVTVSGYWKDNGAGVSVWEPYTKNYNHVVRVELDEDMELTVPDNTSGSPRIDFVVVEVDTAAEPNVLGTNVAQIKIVTGQVADADAGANRYKLAEITVADSETEIEAGHIADKRYYVRLAPVTFDPNFPSGHNHDGINSPKVAAQNITVTPSGNISSVNVQKALEELDTEKSDISHTHILEQVTDVEVTSDELNRNLPSDDQKDALVGAGVPSAANPYATQDFVENQVQAASAGASRVANIYRDDLIVASYDQKKDQASLLTYDEDETVESTGQLQVFEDAFEGYSDKWFSVCRMENEAGESYTNGSFDTDNADRKEGTQSRTISLSTDTTSAMSVDFSPTKDASAFGAASDKLVFWLKVDNNSNVDGATVRLGTGGSPAANYYEGNFLAQILTTGWNRIEVPFSSLVSTGTPDLAGVSQLRFEFSTNAGGGAVFHVDDVQLQSEDNITGGLYEENGGAWDMREVSGETYIAETSETGSGKFTVLSEGNQSRSYVNAIVLFDFLTALRNTTGAGFLFRVQDASNYYMLEINTTADTLALFKVVAGTPTQIGTDETFVMATDTAYKLRVTFSGDALAVEASTDGGTTYSEIIAENDSTYAGGQVGFLGADGIEHFSNISINEILETFEVQRGGKVVRIDTAVGFGEQGDGYETNYKTIFQGDESSLFSNAAIDVDTDHFSLYEGAQKISALSGATVVSVFTPSVALDLSKYSDLLEIPTSDMVAGFVFVDDATKLDHLKVRLVTSSGSYYERSFTPVTGMNRITSLISAFTTTGFPDLSNITSVEVDVKATAAQNVNVSVNGFRVVKSSGVIEDSYAVNDGDWEIDTINIDRYIVQTDRAVGEYQAMPISGANATHFAQDPTGEVRMKGNGGIMLRWVDEDNFYLLQHENGRVSFRKKVAGVYTTIGEEAFVELEDFFSLRAKIDGTSIQYWLSQDNQVYKKLGSITDAAIPSGFYGLLALGGGVTHFDELQVLEKNAGADPYDLLYYNDSEQVTSVIRKP